MNPANPLTHSQGPWQWYKSAFGDWYLGDYEGRSVMHAIAVHPGKSSEQVVVRHARGHYQDVNREHPDAKLVEAAPALLDCLNLVAYSLGTYRTDPADFAHGIETLEAAVHLALSLAQTQPWKPPEGGAA